MTAPVTELPHPQTSVAISPPATERKALTKKEIAADHPTWCPGCGDFSVLALYFKMIEKRKLWQEKFTTISGIGCSSRFPYFVQAYGAHYIHGRSLPFASGISLSRPDLHVFVFGGDGDLFSIGGNHFTHTARKNIKLTCVAMDNWVYGLTKKQTSPTSPLGFKSKTDVWGAVDYPINPVKQAIAADHDGFSFIECLSECVEFYEGAFDAANPRKGGVFNVVPPDHNVTDEAAAYKLASEPFPGYFGLFYKMNKPTKNAKEAGLSEKASAKFQGLKDWQILQKTFNAMK
jgi:2-oxoglutarate ferredoxin oxidoreductase subunit beta